MTYHYHYDATGERIEDVPPEAPMPDRTWRTADEIHRARCAELRAILAAARARREAKP